MKGRIVFLGIALFLLALQPSFAQEATPTQEVAPEEPLIDVATAVANLLRSEEVTGFSESFRAGLATAFANMSADLQSNAYNDATGYADKVVKTMLALMDDEGFATLKGSGFGAALIAFAESIPTMIFGSLRDPLKFGVIESFISVAVLFNNLFASIFSMNTLAAFFSVIESSPDTIARFPQIFPTLYGLFFEGWPVLIEAVVPILMTAGLIVLLDLTSIVSNLMSLDEGAWASVITVPFNALMDVLSTWRGTAFYIMRGTMSALTSGVSLAVSSPRVILGLVVALFLAAFPMSIDLIIAFITYLPGIVLSLGFSIAIGVLNFLALFVAGAALDPVALGASFVGGVWSTISEWLLTILDFFDLKSLRNVVQVGSEGVANLL